MPDREIYAGRVVTLRLLDVPGADGRLHQREIVEHAPGAAIVAVDTDGMVLLVRQYRPAVGQTLLELPAGIVDPDEEAVACAKRELAEETGFAADHVAPLARFYASAAVCTEM